MLNPTFEGEVRLVGNVYSFAAVFMLDIILVKVRDN